MTGRWGMEWCGDGLIINGLVEWWRDGACNGERGVGDLKSKVREESGSDGKDGG